MTSRHDWATSATVFTRHFCEERMIDFEKNGIRFMELTEVGVKDFVNFAERSKELFGTAAAHGVHIRSVHLPFAPFDVIEPASTDPALRRSFVEWQSEIIRVSADRGAQIAVVHPSGEPYDEATREENLKCAIDSLAQITDVANEAGIKLAIENLPRTCIGRDCREMAAIGEAIPGAYFAFDANHSLTDANVDMIKTMGERIVALHISDYDFVDEQHLFPGQGKNPWQAILAALEEVNYSGTWNYEIKNAQFFPAQVFVRNHHHLLKGEIK